MDRRRPKKKGDSYLVFILDDEPRAEKTVLPDDWQVSVNQFGFKTIEEVLNDLYHELHNIEITYQYCRHFKLWGPDYYKFLDSLDEKAEAREFWGQIDLLFVYTLQSSASTIKMLLDSIFWAMLNFNHLTYALGVRALIEQVASLDLAARPLAAFQDRLRKEIWPCGPYCEVLLQDSDHQVHKALFEYALGRRINLTDLVPSKGSIPSFNGWESVRKNAEKKLPDSIKAKSIMGAIDKLDKHRTDTERRPPFRVFYDILCEFCHPNSLSRSLPYSESKSKKIGFMKYFLTGGSPRKRFAIGSTKTISACMPSLCEISLDLLRTTRACIAPLRAVKYVGNAQPLPEGYSLTIDNHGRDVWVYEKTQHVPRLKPPRSLDEYEVTHLNSIALLFRNIPGYTIEELEERHSVKLLEHSLFSIWHLLKTGEIFQQERSLKTFDEEVQYLILEALGKASYYDSVEMMLLEYPQLRAVPKDLLKSVYRKAHDAM